MIEEKVYANDNYGLNDFSADVADLNDYIEPMLRSLICSVFEKKPKGNGACLFIASHMALLKVAAEFYLILGPPTGAVTTRELFCKNAGDLWDRAVAEQNEDGTHLERDDSGLRELLGMNMDDAGGSCW